MTIPGAELFAGEREQIRMSVVWEDVRDARDAFDESDDPSRRVDLLRGRDK
jgi:hypothetical protein